MKTVKPSQLELVSPVEDAPLSEPEGGDVHPDAGPFLEQAACVVAMEDCRGDATEFDWRGDTDAVILHEQRPTAIYTNKFGEIIIRQQAAWDEDEDSFIYIRAENFNTFLDELTKRWRDG